LPALAVDGCHKKGACMKVHSRRVSKTAAITLNGTPERVFPLFGAIEEKKWAEGWNPEILYPESLPIEEHMIFRTPSHFHGEGPYLWAVSKYLPDSLLVEYTVSNADRIWFITIQCSDNKNGTTGAQITYTFTGLTETGNENSETALEHMYHSDLKDWEEAINYYLKTGKIMPHP
jgi:hypothetical protein